MKVAVGTYTGTGVQQDITGFGFTPIWVQVSGVTTQAAMTLRTDKIADAHSSSMDLGWSLICITAMLADGFRVSTGSAVNSNGFQYRYIGVSADVDCIGTSTYNGNGAAGRAIGSPAGWGPDAVIIESSFGHYPWRTTSMSALGSGSEGELDNTVTLSAINSLSATGMVVGNNAVVNTAGNSYYPIWWKNKVGTVFQGSYTGDGNASQTITMGDPFSPAVVIQQGRTAAAWEQGRVHQVAMGVNTKSYQTVIAEGPNIITGFTSSGFTVGSSANTLARVYHYLAFGTTPPPAPTGPPPSVGGGPFALPNAPYTQYKTARAAVNLFNNLQLGP